MNHRMLFILSIVVIVVGVCGIFIQNTQHQPVGVHKSESTRELAPEQKIMVAEALRDLKPYDILTAEDYRLISMRISSTMKDYRDISYLSNKGLVGALVRNHVAKGAFIIPAEIISPTDSSFISASLREGEVPFSLPIFSSGDYILSTTRSGDKMDVYIRLIEVDRNKKSDVGLMGEGSSGAAKNTPQYVTMRLLNNVTVLESKRFDKKKEDGQEKKRFTHEKEEPIGSITLRLNQRQVVELIAVAKTGEFFLLPDGGTESAGVKVRMDEILPQFRSVKELRGRK